MVSTTHQDHASRDRYRERKAERLMMKRLFFIVYPLCLTTIALARISTVFSARDARAEGSVFEEAKASAYAALGYAFHV